MSPKNKAHYESEKEAIHLILNGIGDEIYSTIDACKTAKEIWEAIERANNKRKNNDTSRKNHGHQQQPFKKQNVAKVNNMGMGERKPYEGSLPKCTKCQRHHNGPCTQKCHKCNKRDCPKLKNKNGGNRNAQGWVYAVGNAEKNGNVPMNPDSNVVTGMFLLNNHYASILFYTGADKSFISIAFSSL
nr:hypothetical protein [Tanacetum cinerariifolium]